MKKRFSLVALASLGVVFAAVSFAADILRCGGGNDVALAGSTDTVSQSCEVVK